MPIGVFLDHTDWFREQKGFDVDERLVDTLRPTPRRRLRRHHGGRHDDHGREGAGRARHPALRHPAGLARGGARAPAGAHLRPRRLRRARRGAGGRRRRPAERLRVGGAALRPRRGLGRRRAPAPDPGVRAGQLGVREPLRRADPRPARLVARPVGRASSGDRAGVLAGRPAHPRALADAAAEARRRHGARPTARSSTSRRATRRRCSASPTATRYRRLRRVRLGLPRRPRPGALPRAAARRPGGHRRLPRAQRGVRDVGAGPVRHRVRVDPRLRAVLRLHQGLPVVGHASRSPRCCAERPAP